MTERIVLSDMLSIKTNSITFRHRDINSFFAQFMTCILKARMQLFIVYLLYLGIEEMKGGDCPKTHKLESANFQFETDDSTFSQLRSCFDSVCRIKQQNHDTTVSD